MERRSAVFAPNLLSRGDYDFEAPGHRPEWRLTRRRPFLDKIRESIPSPVVKFQEQATRWLSELRGGRIVNKKTRKPVRSTTINGYSTAVACLCGVVGDATLHSLDHLQAKQLVERMKSDRIDNNVRFGDKTICEYFKVFTSVIGSALENGNMLFPREWNLAYTGS